MVDFLKKYWLFVLLTIIVIFLFLIKLLAAFHSQTAPSSSPSPTPTPKQTLPFLPKPIFISEKITNKTISYQFSLSSSPNLPSRLPVYEYSNVKADTFPEIEFNLSGSPVVLSDSQALEKAEAFLTQKGISQPNKTSRITYRAAVAVESIPVQTIEEADVFVIDFWPKVNNLTVLLDKPTSPFLSVWVGKNDKIQKAFAASFSFLNPKEYPLRSLFVAQDDVLNQKGTLVWIEENRDIEEEEEVFPTLKTVSSLTISRVSLSYFLPSEEQGILEPIYLFEGNTVLRTGEETGAIVYLPAIEEKFLSP